MSNTQKIIIAAGVVLVIIGLTWPWLSKLPFGRLPGDIIVDKPNLKIYIPITTMLLLSAIISLILWLIRKF
ncbi:MAG TPA: DUF2905 domain-containing protein [Ignavibacteriaceae bacterium]|nr:DUF2905 domain-containing protein [Ignavibacteriaceae bacterium]